MGEGLGDRVGALLGGIYHPLPPSFDPSNLPTPPLWLLPKTRRGDTVTVIRLSPASARGLTCDVIPHLRHDSPAFTGKFMPPMPFISAWRAGEAAVETWHIPLFHLFYYQALSAAA